MAGLWPRSATARLRRSGTRCAATAFDVDLIFAPDGIERFADAYARRVEIEGFPVCSMGDIIASKSSANRLRDRESRPRLRAFRDYLRQRDR